MGLTTLSWVSAILVLIQHPNSGWPDERSLIEFTAWAAVSTLLSAASLVAGIAVVAAGRRSVGALAWLLAAGTTTFVFTALLVDHFRELPAQVADLRHRATELQCHSMKYVAAEVQASKRVPPTTESQAYQPLSEALKLRDVHRDRWGHELQARVDPDGHLTLRSTGPDGIVAASGSLFYGPCWGDDIYLLAGRPSSCRVSPACGAHVQERD